MEVEAADLLEQRRQRTHREQKFFRRRKVAVGPDVVCKTYSYAQSFNQAYNYICHGIPNTKLAEFEVPLKDLELDPFAVRSFFVSYSLNKKKRWLIEQLTAEDVEAFQTDSLRVTCCTLATPLQNSQFHSDINVTERILDSQVTRAYNTVKKGVTIQKTSMASTLRSYTYPNFPARYRKGRRIKNAPYNNVQEEKDEDACKSEDDIKHYERKFHQIYAIHKKDRNKSRFNAGQDISKQAIIEYYHWGGRYHDKKREKPRVMKAEQEFQEFDYEEDNVNVEETEEEHAVALWMPPTNEVEIGDFVVQKVAHKKKRAQKKSKVFEDYRPILDVDEEMETENSNEAEEPVESSPCAVVKVDPLPRIDEFDIDIFNTKPLPTVPTIYCSKNSHGDFVIVRKDGFYLNPKQDAVAKCYRKKEVVPEKSIFAEMKTVDSAFVGFQLEAMSSSEAENLAFDLYKAEEESSSEDDWLQVIKPDEDCPICLGEEFQFALSACGHFSFVDCWSNYAAHAIHDNRVPLRCFAEKCSEVLPISILLSFVRQASVRLYEMQLANRRLLQDNFFSCKRCEKFLYAASGTSAKILVCECGFGICRECREEAHVPLSCEGMRKYEDFLKRSGQTFHESSAIHVANGVKCPKCSAVIDLFEGCNHMTCLCGHEFCYACRKPFRGAHYDCNSVARIDYNLVDGEETIHAAIFQKCIVFRKQKNSFRLFKMAKRLEKREDPDTISGFVNTFRQILDFVERAYIHLYLSHQRVHFKRDDFLGRQFVNLVDQRLSFILNRIEEANDVSKLKTMLHSSLKSVMNSTQNASECELISYCTK
ncbi:hypothetical protein L596_011639 [Steinernema carpocapsae]|uniref:RBR-type E3 ubiquitin transferase n=1 Tax=Steinernema carpocapsae TaxID=34508 RepID=A0A4U5NUY0_STECR|nr:hypothetical protein L596_011639 [Steinernema carpocapsae]